MEKEKIIIRLYEILNKEKQGGITIGKNIDDGFDEGIDQGRYIEEDFFKKEIKNLIKDIKS